MLASLRSRQNVNPVSQEKPGSPERFVLSATRERWLAFLPLEHEVLPLPIAFDRAGEEFLVHRAPAPGRPVSGGRIPRDLGPALLLQAAGIGAFLQANGFSLDEDDLANAAWEPGTGRLWLTRTPVSVCRGGPGPALSAVLAGFVQRLFGRGRRVSEPAARALLERLLVEEAPHRRGDFWVASVFRAFPSLAGPESADARRRNLGYPGTFTREAAARARLEYGRALLCGKTARVFARDESFLTPGGALAFAEPVVGVGRAARRLRERHAVEAAGGVAVWIAVEPETWDAVSRRAFEAAARGLAGEVETVSCPSGGKPPIYPDEWRHEVFIPCGTLRASLRLYEEFAAIVREDPAGARLAASELLASPRWASFAADPTGDAPLPARLTAPTAGALDRPAHEQSVLLQLSVCDRPVSGEALAKALPGAAPRRALARLEKMGQLRRDAAGRFSLAPAARAGAVFSSARGREACRLWAGAEEDPARRIEWLLSAGDVEAALEAGESWRASLPPGSPERWFDLSARLAAVCPAPLPPWLEAVEAERDAAGGRPEEAEARLERLADWPAASPAERSLAALRRLELLSRRGRFSEAGRLAAAWRRAQPEAAASEVVRALRVESLARAREGQHEAALELLDEADRRGAGLPLPDGIETALARACVYSLAGRFREEAETYGRFRAAVADEGDETLTARFLSQEALGLADRRDFAGAIARLEEALSVLQDEPAGRAVVLIDLAGTLYHAGRPSRCETLLGEAIEAAASAGREDLVRTARSNRVELMINGCDWEAAAREIGSLVARAREQHDDVRLLVALHHRGRLALRRGQLHAAARDNEDARSLALRCRDRLELGELWLENGDRLALEGDIPAAREAWETAAADPLDRCDSAARAASRLAELDWRETGPPASAFGELEDLFPRDEYGAAETVARWRVLFAQRGFPSDDVCVRAESVLRARGGEALADRAFGRRGVEVPLPAERLRALRDALARSLAGDAGDAPSALSGLGLTGLAIRDARGVEILRLGAGGGETLSRRLAAGAVTYDLEIAPAVDDALASSVALLIETLLYRSSSPPAPAAFAEGWARLGIVTADASMEEPYRRLVRFAPQPVTVLVLGESGSGKEAVARAVHSLSSRASGPFVAVNVAAVPAPLLESELFGHARGAFTGADRDRAGLLEEAGRGTIFFDEIGDLPLPLQAKLLRALQEREIRRVGENRPRRIDARVVSATARDLEKDVEAGRFREDLFYRVHVAVIQLPSLARRGRDVVLLARHFLGRSAAEFARGDLEIAPEALAALSGHSWPGNVRELQNVMAQAVALADAGGVVRLDHLPVSIRRPGRPAAPLADYRSRVDAHRRGLITEALERTGGNRSRAARELGLSRQALLYLIRELNVPARPRSGH